MALLSPSPGIRHASPQASILFVDDDPATRATAGLVLRSLNFDVHEADSGAAAIAAIRTRRFDLALIDFRLPDVSGLGIIVELKRHRISVPWLLMSGWMTTPVAVEAMRLGAVDVVDVPFDIETVVTSALGTLSRRVSAGWPRVPPASLLRRPRSAAERWAGFVLRGCEADHDLKTIADWAAVAGVSYSALTENCRLVGIRPHDARDFLRMLRALFHQKGQLKDIEHGLNVNDHRTMKALLARASLTGTRAGGAISLRAFIDGQQFVDPECEAVRLLINMIAEAGGSSEPGHTATTPS
jgi:DNA-binding response OmpR family regulator